MVMTHDDALALAAAAIDFTLERDDEMALAAHLAACVPCRRRAMALDDDQRSIQALPPHVLDPDRVERVRRSVAGERRAEVSVLRLIAIAALLALLAISAVAVGSRLLRSSDTDLSVVPTSEPAEMRTPESSVPPGGTDPSSLPVADGFAAGSILDVVVSGLRVRTAPTVDDTVSAKLEPLLGLGARLQVIDGPVEADDYQWYLVQAVGLPHRGWVAAADHDGEAWIDLPVATATAVPDLTSEEAELVTRLRSDAAIDCRPRRADLPTAALAGIECELSAGPVQRVGVYGFRDAPSSARAYLDRLTTSGVTPATGDCRRGEPGDAAWSTTGERVDVAAGSLDVGRVGCFLDENGTANVRVTCGPTYIGLLGRDDDIQSLSEWAWFSPERPVATGEPPGICASGV